MDYRELFSAPQASTLALTMMWSRPPRQGSGNPRLSLLGKARKSVLISELCLSYMESVCDVLATALSCIWELQKHQCATARIRIPSGKITGSLLTNQIVAYTIT